MAEYVMEYQGEYVCDVFARENTDELYASTAKERILRCRDCKRFVVGIPIVNSMVCNRTFIDGDPNGFCKWGVRRADDE